MSPESENQQPPPLPAEPAAPIAGYCRACGRALDPGSIRRAGGTIYCPEHVPLEAAEAPSPYAGRLSYPNASSPPAVNPDISPGLAFILGFIPGVGAIYNGQYIKGLIHVAIIGLLISILSGSNAGNFVPLAAFILVGFWCYMPFEAYHTAKFRRSGQPADEVSSLFPARTGSSKFPAAPVILIALGTVLLLDNLWLLDLERALRYWPALLIVAGVYLLYARMSSSRETTK
jgi:hypothetical protein